MKKTTAMMGGLCEERDLRKAEEKQNWREKANDTGAMKEITEVAVQMTGLTPTQRKDEEEQTYYCKMFSESPSSHRRFCPRRLTSYKVMVTVYPHRIHPES